MLYDRNSRYAAEMTKMASLRNAKITLVSFYQRNLESMCKNALSVPVPSRNVPKSTVPPILLQPSFQHVHHVSRFNPTVPYPEANRILS